MIEAPQDYKTAGIFMLVSGVMNGMMSFIFFVSFIWVCIGVFWLIPMIIGILEVVIGIGVLQGQPKPTAKTVSILGIVAGVFSMNVVGIIMEILGLVYLEKPEVKGFLTEY